MNPPQRWCILEHKKYKKYNEPSNELRAATDEIRSIRVIKQNGSKLQEKLLLAGKLVAVKPEIYQNTKQGK